MGITISTGGPDFSGIGDALAQNFIAARRLQQDEDRFQLLKQRTEREMDLEDEEEKRRKAEEDRRQEQFRIGQRARETTPGLIGDMTKAPYVPEGAIVDESQRFEAQIRSNTERLGRIASKIAESDPDKGLDFAQRFLDEGQRDLERLAADRGVTSMLKDIGEAVSTPGSFSIRAGEQSFDDEASIEALKGIMQELEAASGPKVPIQAKLDALQNANKTRQQIRKDLVRRNEQEASKAAARNTIATRMAEGGARLSTSQVGRLGALSANVGYEDGMVTPEKVDAEVDRIMRGTVQVPNPFTFGGGDVLEMTPESAAKLQESLAKIQESQSRQFSNKALESQRLGRAKESEARADLARRTDPNARNGKASGLAAKYADLQARSKAEGWDRAKAEEELRKAGIDPTGPMPK